MAVTAQTLKGGWTDTVGKSSGDVVTSAAFGVLTAYRFGNILFFTGTGDPNGDVTAAQGTIMFEDGEPNIFINTDGSTTWVSAGTLT